ncbi:hypothetical protein V5O48_019600, partial [Marasmius crinis-equi]
RNSYLPGDSVHDPVAVLTRVVKELSQKYPDDIGAIPVVITPFRQNHLSSCYLSLHQSVAYDVSTREPRIDLLMLWKKAIEAHADGAEVVFAPAKDGADKRMWVRFPSIVSALDRTKSPIPEGLEPAEHVKDLLRRHLEKEKIEFSAIFTVGGKAAVADLVFTKD